MAFAALIYFAIAALLFRDLLPVITTHLYGDLGDPLLNTAILAWNAKHLPLTTEWWNFPAFAPLSGITAFTEHFIGAYPLTSPIIWLTGNPVLAYNVLELACFTLNGVFAYALVRELTTSKVGGFVGGLAFAFAPLFAEHVTHIQMLMAFGMPVALLGLHRYIKDGRRVDVATFAIGWLFVVLSNAYLLVFFPILLVLWAFWFFREAPLRRWLAIVSAASIVILAVVPLLIGYRFRQTAYGLMRPLDEIKEMSATFSSIAGISHYVVLWRRWLPNTYYEASLFPGFAIALLAIIGVASGRRPVVWFYLCAAILMWAFALGPERGPYWLLLKLPGAQAIRVPARAWIVGMLCLAVCAGFGASWLAAQRRSAWIAAVLAVLIVAEVWFKAPIVAAPVPIPYVIPAGAMVLDLPLALGYENADAQYRAVMGDYRVINGYSGYLPQHVGDLRRGLADHRPEILRPFRALADIYVIVRAGLVERPLAMWIEGQPDIEHILDVENWRIYRLPHQGPVRPPALPLPLPKRGERPIVIP
jgi:hypothetical protein